MAASGTVSAPLSGSPLTFTDTSTGLPTITSRVLTIYDPNNVLLTTINMGASLTATYAITSDQWLRFVLTLNGGAYTATVDYLSENFYYNTLLDNVKNGCGCNNSNSLCSDTAKAMMCDSAALFYTLYGFGVNANNRITDTNTLINA